VADGIPNSFSFSFSFSLPLFLVFSFSTWSLLRPGSRRAALALGMSRDDFLLIHGADSASVADILCSGAGFIKARNRATQPAFIVSTPQGKSRS